MEEIALVLAKALFALSVLGTLGVGLFILTTDDSTPGWAFLGTGLAVGQAGFGPEFLGALGVVVDSSDLVQFIRAISLFWLLLGFGLFGFFHFREWDRLHKR